MVNILQRDGTLVYTFGLYTMVRNPTSVLCAVEGLVREVPLPDIFELYTMVRNLISALFVEKLLPINMT